MIGLMICKKGSGVEVLEKREEPLGSWRSARILSGNGHTYVVKYDICPPEKDVLTNKVPRKALRPLPPPVEVKSLVCADLVEVCDDGAWKVAEVLRTLDSNMVAVRFLGSSKEIVTPLFNLRMPQIWKYDLWIPLNKETLEFIDDVEVNVRSKKRKLSSQLPGLSVVEKKCKRADECAEKHGDYADQLNQKSLGKLKRKSWECRAPVYPHVEGFGKKKQIKKEGRCYELTERNLPNQLFEKVDAVNSPQNFYGEKHMNSAFNHETVGFGQIGMYCRSQIPNAGPNHVASLDLLDDASTTSSVGSCSAINGLSRPLYHNTYRRRKLCDPIDDRESFYGSPTEPSHFREEETPQAIHWLELDAYRSTLRSLSASGSLTWNQESLLTNLRRALNISNDEHLSELKKLKLTRS